MFLSSESRRLKSKFDLFNPLRIVRRLFSIPCEASLQRRKPILIILTHRVGVLLRRDLGRLARSVVVADLDLRSRPLTLNCRNGRFRDLAFAASDQSPSRVLDAACSRCYKTFFGGNLHFPKIKKIKKVCSYV